MAFVTADRLRLVKVLNLHRDQLKSSSVLVRLMTALETFDTANSTSLVGEVRDALGEYEDNLEAIAAVAGNDGLKITDVENEIRVENFGPGAATSSLRAKGQGYVNTIRKYLDPLNELYPYSLTGRVIRTL